MDSILIVFCTFPDPATARQIGTVLVEKQLAACINLIPCVESIYRWQGKIESQGETLAMIKTTAGAFPSLENELTTLHPYEVPELIALKPEQVAEGYAAWVLGEVVVGHTI